MDKIFHSTFDFFSHALPGFFILVSCYVFDGTLNSPEDFVEHAGGLNIGEGVFLLVTGYVIGFAVYPFGRWLYRNIGKKIFPGAGKIQDPMEQVSIYDKFVLAREVSPTNFKYVETWHMYCAMSHNLAIACMVVFVAAVFRAFSSGVEACWFFCLLAGLAALLFFVFLRRAVVFSGWAANDLNCTIALFHLNKKAPEKTAPRNK